MPALTEAQTSLKHRDEFNRMIADCKAGKIDMIVTKSVSRFARNVEDFIGTEKFVKGDSYFIPAGYGGFTVNGVCRLLITTE